MFNFKYDVKAEQFLKEAEQLLQTHWEELALNKDRVKLNPDVAKYSMLQELGMLYNIVVYNKEDEIVGYSVILSQPHVHYKDSVYASVDVIYVDPKHRNSSLGARLLLETEKVAKAKGAHVLIHHAKPYVPMIIKPLEKLGYSLYEHIYGKYIGEK